MNTAKQLKLVFIHGAGGSRSKWRTIMPLLDEEVTDYIDLPGHGENRDECCETIEDYAKKLATTITEDCIVVGHSMGGLIALELGKINEHVQGVVLAASAYELPVHPKIIDTLAEGTFPEIVFLASYAPDVDPLLLEEEKRERDALDTNVALLDFQACNKYASGEATLTELAKPIAAILGDQDRLIPATTAEDFKKVNARVDVAVIEEAGHYVALEKPEAFVEHLLVFKRKVANE